MAIRILSALTGLALLAACAVPPEAPGRGSDQRQTTSASVSGRESPRAPVSQAAARAFIRVAERVEPVAESYCRSYGIERDCDIEILVDDRASSPPNAYQTLGENGRPVIVFTAALIGFAASEDELAFILAHEAAHHVLGHIAQVTAAANTGAGILGSITSVVTGPGSQETQLAAEIGAALGARRFAKAYELQADELGARIAASAGYDPLAGANIFLRLPDPGNAALSTHPSNAERLAAVRRAMARG